MTFGRSSECAAVARINILGQNQKSARWPVMECLCLLAVGVGLWNNNLAECWSCIGCRLITPNHGRGKAGEQHTP